MENLKSMDKCEKNRKTLYFVLWIFQNNKFLKIKNHIF